MATCNIDPEDKVGTIQRGLNSTIASYGDGWEPKFCESCMDPHGSSVIEYSRSEGYQWILITLINLITLSLRICPGGKPSFSMRFDSHISRLARCMYISGGSHGVLFYGPS